MAVSKSDGSKPSRSSKSKSQKAGLLLPASRINRYLRSSSSMKRVGGSAPVYLTGVLEYVVSEILEVAGNHCLKAKRKRVSAEDVVVAVRGDSDLSKLCACASMYMGNRLPIHASMLKPVDKPPPRPKAAAAS